MIKNNLIELGETIANLRIAKNLKQSELAYESGISERTLQRIEAGETVKSDGLLKVIDYLGKLQDLLKAIDTPNLSPYELAKAKPTVKPLKRALKTRVRHSGYQHGKSLNKTATAIKTPRKIIWPEDQP